MQDLIPARYMVKEECEAFKRDPLLTTFSTA
jgi:hypothetical protein